MSENVERVAVERVEHRQPVDVVLEQRADALVQRLGRLDRHERPDRADRRQMHRSPRLDALLLELRHRRLRVESSSSSNAVRSARIRF